MPSRTFVPSRRGENRARVLVAEDDRDLRRMVSAVMAYDGYEVVEVEDGRGLLEQLSEHGDSIDVVVSDIFMPGLSGLDVLARMRERGIAAPVVLMTAFPEQCTEAGARALGAVTLVEKPFELDDLRMIVMNLLPSERHGRAQDHQ